MIQNISLKLTEMEMWIFNITCIRNYVGKYLYIPVCQDIKI